MIARIKHFDFTIFLENYKQKTRARNKAMPSLSASERYGLHKNFCSTQGLQT